METLKAFEKKLGASFKNSELLRQALTHRSYLNEHRGAVLDHNERLEFLGDAVLELIVTEYLFKTFPSYAEGEMTSLRASVVNADTLSRVSMGLGVNDYIRLSRGEAKDQGRARQYILADAFEAIVGAIFLDQGYAVAGEFVARHTLSLLDKIIRDGSWIDSKSLFQEEAQERASVTPLYETVKEEGPDHDKVFTVGVFLGSVKVAEGQGKSKQDAEQVAAREALKQKRWKKA